jgi:hypothetical protein
MNGLKKREPKRRAPRLGTPVVAIVTLITLFVGLGSASAVQDQFTVDLGGSGEILGGTGTGFNHGTWYYYPSTDQLVQWFFNGPIDRNRKKVIDVDVTARLRDVKLGTGWIEVSVNWTKLTWPEDQDGPPLPDPKSPDLAQQYIEDRVVIQRTEIRDSTFINTSLEIENFCPQWVSIDIRGTNVSVEGQVRHDCVAKDGPVPPVGDRDFGDAPEGVTAYPSLGITGLFPTCVGVGPAAWIEHESSGQMRFGRRVDVEREGNAGRCPTFNPDQHNQDEGMNDGDAGLLKPRAYTIKGPAGFEDVFPLIFTGLESLGNACFSASWGSSLDIEVYNNASDGRDAYVNVLMDWDHDGKWEKAVACDGTDVPEHALVNFRVPNGYSGPLSGLNPPSIKIGPLAGYVWARFTISEREVPLEWNGDGVFKDGETEDYLLHVKEPLTFCTWKDGDPHKMHWAQLPDTRETGIDVDMFWSSLADDFRCAQNGPITDIHFWGSFADDVMPPLGSDSMTFKVSIYANREATSLIPWSRPGELLWTKDIPRFSYDVSEITNNIWEGWFDPASKFYERGNHKRTFQFNICFDPEDELFIQRLGTMYWLEIKHVAEQDAQYTFGWKTTRQSLQFEDAAVWRHPSLGWMPMSYPSGHESEGKRMDLSFVITGEPPEDVDFGDCPDPTYPTVHVSNGARHTIVPGVYLGKGVDGDPDGQPNAGATGDDLDGSDDEDGVVFTTDLTAGQTAVVEVTASTQGVLNAWIDWNADGDWDDLGEHLFVDQTLAAGVNPLPFSVPLDAVEGRTFTRFRFSKARGLQYNGLALDGEVEDYLVEIEGVVVVPPKPPLDHLKWSQPPIERDLTSRLPIYCGWDEPAFANKPFLWTGTYKLVADDFRCVGSMPVTSVHWWGSYDGWQNDDPPQSQPESWQIAFWSNVPADTRYPFSRPGKVLWVVNATPSRVEEEKVGVDEFPQKPSETTFQYLLKLQQHEYFWQDRYLSDTTENVFWISITAVYTSYPEPRNPWGWKTRPEPWMDAAVKAEFRNDTLRMGFELDPATAQPITDSLVCERLDKYDMAFELDTDPAYIKWEQAFTGIRDWPHYEDEESVATEGGPGAATKWLQPPDITSSGIDVDITKDIPPTWPTTICADDFECRESGPITMITLWASWYHDVLPGSSPESATFTLSIRQDVPAGRSPTGYSMPGPVLWQKEFKRGQFTVEPIEGPAEGYYSPANSTYEANNHLMVYKYIFKIDPAEAFEQTGTERYPVVYWLSAQASLIHAPGTVATRFGWKTSTSHWNDAAVWVRAEEPYDGMWNELAYPKEHPLGGRPIDLAFSIDTETAGTGTTARQVVADDWRCSSDLPVSSIVWWGSYIGYEYRPCECQSMAAPRKPDAFLLSIWSDDPDSKTFSQPGRKLWEYRAETFDEVMVGFDKHPELFSSARHGYEPVYRYTVRLPEQSWFRQDGQSNVCWLSVVAVYEDAQSIVYPWGWTNHPSGTWAAPGQTLLAHWKLDETSGTTASDSSGNGNHGTLFGSPVWRPASGWIDGALDFDGRNDYIKVEKPVGFDFAPKSFSVSAWIYPKETRGLWHAIMEYDRFTVNGNRFGLWLDTNGRFHFRVGQNTWQTTTNLMPDQWYHLTATFDGTTKEMRLYLNGLLEATATNQSGFVWPRQSTLTIGVCGTMDNEFFNGLMDDVRVYGAALSDEDVLVLAGAGRNDGAVAAAPTSTGAWTWTQLFDQTGAIEDMSFVLFTEPGRTLTEPGPDVIVIRSPEKK